MEAVGRTGGERGELEKLILRVFIEKGYGVTYVK